MSPTLAREEKKENLYALTAVLIMFLFILLTLTAGGCSNATWSAATAWGQDHHVKQFSGGKLIGEWCSTGKINNEQDSDGYYFQDRKTDKLVTISGDVQITVGCEDMPANN